MSDLVAWLREQLDEDEALARQAFADHNAAEARWTEIWSGAVQLGEHEDLLVTNDSGVSRHIVRHDPKHVLAEVESKRRILDEIVPEVGGMAAQIENEFGTGRQYDTADEKLLRLLALPYADRPGYDSAWAPESSDSREG